MSRPLRYLSIDRPARGRDLSVLAVLVALSLGFAALSPERQIFVSQRLQSSVLSPFLKLHEAFAEHSVTMGRVASLTEERNSLAAELAENRQNREIPTPRRAVDRHMRGTGRILDDLQRYRSVLVH